MILRACTAAALFGAVAATTIASVGEPVVGNKPETAEKDLAGSQPNIADKSNGSTFVMSQDNRKKPVEINGLMDPFASLRQNSDIVLDLASVERALSIPARSKDIRPVHMVPKLSTNDLRIPTDPKTGKDLSTGRIKIKFNDDYRARAELIPSDQIISLSGRNVNPTKEIVARYGGTIRQLINMAPTELLGVQQIAFERSNRIQPDLASLMVIEFPVKDLGNILAAAQELNQLDALEWVTIEKQVKLAQVADWTDAEGGCQGQNNTLCNRPSTIEVGTNETIFPDAANPISDGGQYSDAQCTFPPTFPPGVGPGPGDPRLACGPPPPNFPFTIHGSIEWAEQLNPPSDTLNNTSDGACTALVCGDPRFAYCCEGLWDGLCVEKAIELCGSTWNCRACNCWAGEGSVAPFPGACNAVDQECEGWPDPTATPPDPPLCSWGCQDAQCCDTVSALLPQCAEQENNGGWDALCAGLANVVCNGTVYDQQRPDLRAPNVPLGPRDDRPIPRWLDNPAVENQRYDPCLSTYIYNTLSLDNNFAGTYDPGSGDQPVSYTHTVGANPVFDNVRGILLGACFEVHPLAGCSEARCCVKVCLTDPICCIDSWDDTCVGIAQSTELSEFCGGGGIGVDGPTPDFAASLNPDTNLVDGYQAYMRQETVTNFLPPPFGPGTIPNFTYGNPGEDQWTVENYKWSTTPDNPVTGEPGEPTINSQFLYSGYTGGGWDIQGLEELAGQLWRNYGAGNSITNGFSSGNTLLNPNKVWLYGAEFEVLKTASGRCPSVDGGFYDCSTCFDVDKFPGFVEGGFPNDSPAEIANWRLCPTGEKVGGAVLEFGAYVAHEAFTMKVFPTDSNPDPVWFTNMDRKVFPEPGQTIVVIPNSVNSPDHGTACLGVMVAANNSLYSDDPAAQSGVRGIASEAQGYFFPIFSVEDGERLEGAIASAVQKLPIGSVMNFSIGGGNTVITADPAVYTLIRLASDSNLVSCLAAGNDCSPLAAEAGEDSGALIVGACWPRSQLIPSAPCTLYGRLGFSNWGDELPISISAWGTGVATAGYGTLFKGAYGRYNQATTTVYENPFVQTELEQQFLRTYCGPNPIDGQLFNGTSAACPQVAGASIWMQGFSKMFYDQFLTSDQVKVVLASAVTEQCGVPVDFLPGNDNAPCLGDLFFDEEIHPIVGYPSLVDCALNILVRLGEGFAGDFDIYTGNLVSGNTLALGQLDNNRLVISSEFSGQGPGPNGMSYPATGPTTDLGVVFETGYEPSAVTDCSLTVAAASNASIVIEVPYARNQTTQRYIPLGATILTAGVAQNQYAMDAFGAPSTYFTEIGDVDIRIYTVGLGFLGTNVYSAIYDQIALNVNTPFGEAP
jgi:hypothetical protein